MDTIPIISGLTNDQFEALLSICEKQKVTPYTVIFKEGDCPGEMYILTEGFLKVTLKGKELNKILPISTVGEMGVFTGEPRSATITSVTRCTVLKILKKDLFNLFRKDKDFHIKFQEGMLVDLSQKLRLTNEVITKLRTKLDQGPERF